MPLTWLTIKLLAAHPDQGYSVDQFTSTFLAAVIGVGVIMAIFLIVNHRNNLKRQKSRQNHLIPGPSPAPKPEDADHFKVLDDHPTPSAICRNDGIILYVNKIFATVFGSSPTNMQRLLIFNILPAHISATLSETIRESGPENVESLAGFYSPTTKTRYKLVSKKFNSHLTDSSNLLVTLERMPRHDEIPASSGDEAREVILQLLNIAPYAIFIEDYEGRILQVNNAACEMQGVERHELMGKVLDEFSPGDFRKEIAQRQQIMASNSSIVFKSITYPKSSAPIPVEIQVSKIKYFGKEALFFILRDLSESIEKKKELDEYKIKAEESDRLKSSFLANLSHEVRTPMNSIMGFAELLAEQDISEKERREFIKLIRQSGKELLTQINNMIDFSKIEAGLVQLKVEICNFETVFHQLHEFWLEEIRNENEVKLFFELPQEMLRNGIASDRIRLKQILKVFLSNSIKYTQKGVIEIGVRSKAPQLYEFYVRDTGVGISEDKHRQVFEKFRQADDTNERQFSGMGVGLSVAARLVQFLGGHQWVVSEPGKGSEFRFVLPDLLFPQRSPFMQVSCGPVTMINKLMVVAPSEEIYQDLCQNSKPVNYQVFWAQNAQEMKSMLLSNNIRFIIIAVDQLPFWQELLPKIRSINNSLQLIGVSNQLDSKRKERLLSMGLNEVIRTPVNIPILLNILERKEVTSMNILSTVFHQN
ncbi:histidine kinase [Geofilum rubicundum JCM 15548]|uniref:histidine kinase n=2 Tax=Geofilum TaxID=1236988 RepID=A0A0E9LZ91_9BACT|nr:histidine kinase [Geofilum rubicundum JCM 15548]